MLVHICCSVDSHFFVSELKRAYPNDELVGFFYDPNIHPHAEYELRYLDVKRSCDKLGVRLYKGSYDFAAWLNATKGFENEPEKGARCELCFDLRLKKAVKFARKIGEKRLTTTLLTSPKKDFAQLENALKKQCEPYGIDFVAPDFRKNGGTQRQFGLAKRAMLYHQNYCGCLFALSLQRQNRAFVDELMSPITRQVLPASILDRMALYKKVMKLEKMGVKFKLVREKFLNYRLLSAKICADKTPIKAHILFYSHFKNGKICFNAASQSIENLGFGRVLRVHKDELIFWDFELLNSLCGGKFKDFGEFLKKPLSAEKEIILRLKFLSIFGNLSFENGGEFGSEFYCGGFESDVKFSGETLKNSQNLRAENLQILKAKIAKMRIDLNASNAFNAYNLSPIIVCEKIPQGRVEITAKSEIYFDTREKIVKI